MVVCDALDQHTTNRGLLSSIPSTVSVGERADRFIEMRTKSIGLDFPGRSLVPEPWGPDRIWVNRIRDLQSIAFADLGRVIINPRHLYCNKGHAYYCMQIRRLLNHLTASSTRNFVENTDPVKLAETRKVSLVSHNRYWHLIEDVYGEELPVVPQKFFEKTEAALTRSRTSIGRDTFRTVDTWRGKVKRKQPCTAPPELMVAQVELYDAQMAVHKCLDRGRLIWRNVSPDLSPSELEERIKGLVSDPLYLTGSLDSAGTIGLQSALERFDAATRRLGELSRQNAGQAPDPGG